jgi:hypothetical protein
MRKVIFLNILLFIFFLSNSYPIFARSGCCSHHSGVCGCGCCDGTPLSSTCAPYYPECSGGGSVQQQQPTFTDYVPTSTPYIPLPTNTPRPFPTWTPTPTLTPTNTPTLKPTEIIIVSPTIKPIRTALQKVVKKQVKKSFWQWLFHL